MYKNKYLKYKQKYLDAKKLYSQTGGDNSGEYGIIYNSISAIKNKQNKNINEIDINKFNTDLDNNIKLKIDELNKLNVNNNIKILNNTFGDTGVKITYNDLESIFNIINTNNTNNTNLSDGDLNLLVKYKCANNNNNSFFNNLFFNNNISDDEIKYNKDNIIRTYINYKEQIDKLEYEIKTLIYLLNDENKITYNNQNNEIKKLDKKLKELTHLIAIDKNKPQFESKKPN